MLAFFVSLGMMAALTSSLNHEEMSVSAAGKTLNIITTFGTSETYQYGVPNAFNARYEAIAEKVADRYSVLGLELNFTKPTTEFVRMAPADECGINRNNFELICLHSSLVSCNNYGPYHCTNAYYNRLYLFPLPRPVTNGIEMYLTAMPLCIVKDESHHLIDGVQTSGYIAVRDSDFVKGDAVAGDSSHVDHVSATLAHEIGHMYGIEDHYSVEFGDRRDNCIWGYNHKNFNVVSNISICLECYDTLDININDIEF